MAILLITHDLGVVARMAHRVALMYAGELVEIGDRKSFFARPLHPYAARLFAALPGSASRGSALTTIPGMVPPLTSVFAGCRFAPRCAFAHARCEVEVPGWNMAPGNGAKTHVARCHLLEEGDMPPARPEAGAAAAALPGNQGDALLEVRDLKVHFPIRRGLFRRTVGHVRAVDGVSFSIGAGRTLALVGESGCGKTTVGKGLLQLVKPTAGSIRFDGHELAGAPARLLHQSRSLMQIVFQDPFASLNPRMRVGEIISEGMASFGLGGDQAGREREAASLLAQVGLPADARDRYPHEFSGGQRQRIAIARALAVEPRLIVCDEPTSALDVSVQAQILNLLSDLQRERGVSLLFITHNLAVVEHLAHDIAVMYLGRIVESGTAEEVLSRPRHPYTQALLAAVPRIDSGAVAPLVTDRKLFADLPSPANPPAGCHFHTRCPRATPECAAAYPGARTISPTHRVHCIHAQ
jgi:peptide/nickel transport system ATP-binding protein